MAQATESLSLAFDRDQGITDQVLWARLRQSAKPAAFALAWLELQARMIGGIRAGVVLAGTADDGPFMPLAVFPEDTQVSAELSIAVEMALSQRKGVVRDRAAAGASGALGAGAAIALPLLIDDALHGAAAFDIEARPAEEMRQAMRQVQWGFAWLETMVRRQSLLPKQWLVMAIDVVAAALDNRHFFPAVGTVTSELASLLSCEWTACGFSHGSQQVKVAALSHSAAFKEKSSFMRGIASAMEEAIDQAEIVMYPQPEHDRPLVTRAHQALADADGAGAVLTVPFGEMGCLVGAVTLKRGANTPFSEQEVEFCRHAALVLGPILEAKRREDRWIGAKVWGSFRGELGRLVGPRHVGRKLVAAAILGTSLFFSIATGDFEIAADAVLEGAVQRAMTSPIDGYIATAEARAGDAVSEGDLLASLDISELRIEAARWQSQLDQYRQEYRKALAAGERTEVRILSTQIEQARARLALLDEQIERAAIRAPFDGIIVSGDLSRNLGAPVKRGDVLFEVAPLDRYRVILKVDERDISILHEGQIGRVILSALPEKEFPIVVSKITPVSTAEEGRNYFRVEARFESRSDLLRPGMQGLGKMYIEERGLWWIWTRRLVHWVRLTLWSWMP